MDAFCDVVLEDTWKLQLASLKNRPHRPPQNILKTAKIDLFSLSSLNSLVTPSVLCRDFRSSLQAVSTTSISKALRQAAEQARQQLTFGAPGERTRVGGGALRQGTHNERRKLEGTWWMCRTKKKDPAAVSLGIFRNMNPIIHCLHNLGPAY